MICKFSLPVLCLLLMTNAFGQEAGQFKKFRVLLGAGYAMGSGYTSGGIFGTLEPGYRISDRITSSLRAEFAGIARGDYEGLSVNVDISKISSFTVNAVYYFGDEFVRPFAGFGAGSYRLSSIEYKLDGSGTNQGTGNSKEFGFYPRIGVETGHVHFSLDYNVIPKTEADGAEFKNSYFAIRVGVFFGGGRKNQ